MKVSDFQKWLSFQCHAGLSQRTSMQPWEHVKASRLCLQSLI